MKRPSRLTDSGYQVLIDHLQDGIFVIEDQKFTYVNQRLADMFGYTIEALLDRPFIELVADEDKIMVSERHRARLAGGNVPELYDLHIVTGHGATICCSMNVGLSVGPEGRLVAVGSVRDVTQQRIAQAELRASKEELKSIFDHLPDVFYRTDMQGIITRVSPSCFELLGYLPEEVLGTPMAAHYYTPEDRQKVVQAITDGGGKAIQVEAALRRKDGSIIWVSTSAYICYGEDGKPYCIEGMARDISERKRMEDQLVMLSRIDALTGACNRGYFMDKADEVIPLMRRYQRPASMLMADLDHFKSINDRYGHHAGDLALQAFAKICSAEIREPDIFGRMGGEEFALMLPETHIQDAQVLAERIRKATAATLISLDGQVIGITVSIGLVEVGTGERALESALRRADAAMYKAKESGRNQVVTA